MARIVIFDSGVGGLSIHEQLSILLPNEEYLFVSDNAAFPYGIKSDEQLASRVLPLVAQLILQLEPEVLVVACNTASTALLDELRSNHPDVQIVGVVPALKPAAQLSQSKVIGLLATPATIQRAYTARLIRDFASHCEVINIGSSKMVEIAEDKLYGRAIDAAAVQQILEPVLARQECDVLVLACTHFPLLEEEITDLTKRANRKISILDSGAAIARRVHSLLEQNAAISLTRDAPSRSLFTSSIDDQPLLQRVLRKRKIPYDSVFEHL